MVFQVRAAAGRIRHDVVVARERACQLLCLRKPIVEASGMRMERAAAALRTRHVHVVAVGVQDARRCNVDVAEDDACDAPREERDFGAVAGQVLGRPLRRNPRRRDLP